MQVSEIYTVEYSVVQKCYHIDTLDKTLKNNLRAVDKLLNNGYLVIGIFRDYDSASHFVQYHREHRRLSDFTVNGLGELDF